MPLEADQSELLLALMNYRSQDYEREDGIEGGREWEDEEMEEDGIRQRCVKGRSGGVKNEESTGIQSNQWDDESVKATRRRRKSGINRSRNSKKDMEYLEKNV